MIFFGTPEQAMQELVRRTEDLAGALHVTIAAAPQCPSFGITKEGTFAPVIVHCATRARSIDPAECNACWRSNTERIAKHGELTTGHEGSPIRKMHSGIFQVTGVVLGGSLGKAVKRHERTLRKPIVGPIGWPNGNTWSTDALQNQFERAPAYSLRESLAFVFDGTVVNVEVADLIAGEWVRARALANAAGVLVGASCGLCGGVLELRRESAEVPTDFGSISVERPVFCHAEGTGWGERRSHVTSVDQAEQRVAARATAPPDVTGRATP